MTNIDLIKEKLNNVKDSEGNIICTVEDDLLNTAIFALNNYLFKEELIDQKREYNEYDKNFFLNKEWTTESKVQDKVGFAEFNSVYDKITIVYRDKKAESIYFTSMPGISVKKYINPDKTATITIEGYSFAYHVFPDGITRDCDLDFMIGSEGKVHVRQKVSDCNPDLRIMDRSESYLLFDSFNDFELYHSDLDRILETYSHKKVNLSK